MSVVAMVTDKLMLPGLKEYNIYVIYISLFIATTFVNKYVLSILRFTYPTIFQGWQVLVGLIILRGLSVTAHIEVKVMNTSRSVLVRWLPAALLFTSGIYTGSVALSQLPIPIFLSLYCLIASITTAIDCLRGKKSSSSTCLLVPMVTILALLTAWTDPKFTIRSYLWMAAHVMSVVCYRTYDKMLGPYMNLSPLDKIFCNYAISVLVLTPCSFLMGDVLAAKKFEFFYFYRFYIGCVGSGVFGVFLALCSGHLMEASPVRHNHGLAAGMAKIVASLLSSVWFDFLFTAINVAVITATLVANLALTTTVASNFDREITIEDTGGSIPKNEQFLYTKKKDSFENVHVIKDGLGV